MRLNRIRIKNFRSITDSGDVSLEPLQAFVGENNAGKSNILRAVSCFLSPGAGGMKVGDFKDISDEAIIECEFGDINQDEKQKLRPYLLGEKVILSKFLHVERDEDRGKTSIKCDYHGYQAEPREVHLSILKIEEAHNARPRWSDIA